MILPYQVSTSFFFSSTAKVFFKLCSLIFLIFSLESICQVFTQSTLIALVNIIYTLHIAKCNDQFSAFIPVYKYVQQISPFCKHFHQVLGHLTYLVSLLLHCSPLSLYYWLCLILQGLVPISFLKSRLTPLTMSFISWSYTSAKR